MKTNRILIAMFFPFLLAACASENTDDNLSPITRWAFAAEAGRQIPQWKKPSDSCEKIEEHWDTIVNCDMGILWKYIERPELIQDSTVIQLTGEYVKSDSLPAVFSLHMARLDTATNAADNYMIDQRRLYSTNPDAIPYTPITAHTIDQHTAEMAALQTALSLHRQVLAIERNATGETFGSVVK